MTNTSEVAFSALADFTGWEQDNAKFEAAFESSAAGTNEVARDAPYEACRAAEGNTPHLPHVNL